MGIVQKNRQAVAAATEELELSKDLLAVQKERMAKEFKESLGSKEGLTFGAVTGATLAYMFVPSKPPPPPKPVVIKEKVEKTTTDKVVDQILYIVRGLLLTQATAMIARFTVKDAADEAVEKEVDEAKASGDLEPNPSPADSATPSAANSAADPVTGT